MRTFTYSSGLSVLPALGQENRTNTKNPVLGARASGENIAMKVSTEQVWVSGGAALNLVGSLPQDDDSKLYS